MVFPCVALTEQDFQDTFAALTQKHDLGGHRSRLKASQMLDQMFTVEIFPGQRKFHVNLCQCHWTVAALFVASW